MDHQPLAREALVELIDQYSDVYPFSPTGARGWVRARREMPKRDPEVYIEWDKTHWRYHGEADGWTFEHHFRPVDDAALISPEPEDELSMHRILAEAQAQVDSERCPDCGGFHEPGDTYIDTLAESQDAALEAEAFLTITLAPVQDGDHIIYEPQVFNESLSDVAQQMIETQIIHIAMQILDRAMLERVNTMRNGNDPGR